MLPCRWIGAAAIFALVPLCGLWATDVSGTITYAKTVISSSGTSTQTTAVNGATVHAYAAGSSTVISSTTTDANGAYAFTGLAPASLKITVHSEGSLVKVGSLVSGTTVTSVHATEVSSSTTGGAGVNLHITDATTAAAFNVYIQLLRGRQYLASLSSPLTTTSVTSALFPTTTEGTQYKPVEDYLVIQNASGDPDGFDDDIILHEFGHWTAEHFSKDSSQGGQHTATQSVDLRLSWSEGLAHYISSAIRGDPQHLDFGTSGINRFNISSPGSATGTDVELAVANVLWSTAQANSHANVFSVLASFKTSIPASFSSDPISFDTFYDMWKGTFSSSSIDAFTNDRSMSYFIDANNSFTISNPKSISTPDSFSQSSLSFFTEGNVDYFSFQPTIGSNYNIQTSDLKNGALTEVKLYFGNLTELVSTALPYQTTGEGYIFLSTARDGVYYVSISRYNNTGTNYGKGYLDGYTRTVGRYGSYTFNVAKTSSSTAQPPSSSVATVLTGSGGNSGGSSSGGGGCLLK